MFGADALSPTAVSRVHLPGEPSNRRLRAAAFSPACRADDRSAPPLPAEKSEKNDSGMVFSGKRGIV